MKIEKQIRSGILLISIKVCLVTSLTCMQCYSRVHKGCTNLDYAVRHQECVGDEVCAKFSTWRMKRGPNGVMIPYGKVGTIRDCVKPDPNGLNSCLQVGNDMQPRVHCFCNTTNFCNSSPGGHHQYNSLLSNNWKLILISLLIFQCAQFFLAFS